MKGVRRWSGVCALSLVAFSGASVFADVQKPATIEERAKGAERVVVATVTHVTSRFERNEFGDELIVSRASLAVEEALKGAAESTTLEYEGGTVNGLTLHVSSLPGLSAGERAVFFLTRGKNGEFKPHLRGQGILKLDRENHVQGSSLTLDDVRRMARQQGR
jgi:hypothetical protein